MKSIRYIYIFLLLMPGISACSEFYFPDSSFTSREDSMHQSLNFFVLSDWGFNGNYSQIDVAKAMAEWAAVVHPSFILTTGDNFQISGVDCVNDPLWSINYEEIYRDSSLMIPWYPALGNHDHYGNIQAEIDYSKISSRWTMPSAFYTFTKEIPQTGTQIRFIVLDTQSLVDSTKLFSSNMVTDSVYQLKWLKNTLENAAEKWIIVTGHHPVYSSAPFHGDTPEMKAYVKPLLEQFGVDFYICGHDHHFEHIRNGRMHNEYIITGTGSYVRAVLGNSKTVFKLSKPGFTNIEVTSKLLRLYFVTSDSKTAYYYSKYKTYSFRK